MEKVKAEKLLSTALKKQVRVKEIRLIGSGYHSDGYKITTSDNKHYFIKQVKSHDLGFEFPGRKLSSLALSHSMNTRVKAFPRSIGVIAENKELESIPEITDDTVFYNIQEYGGDGKNYLQIIEERKTRKHMGKDDIDELKQVVDFIVKIHKIKHPSKDKKQLNAVYNDYLRNVIGHQEYTLQLLHAFPKDAPILSPKQQADYMGLLLEQMHYWKDRSDRMTALHGDFWAANAILSGKKIYFVDYSRMPWGDPAMDIGFWTSLYVFMWHNTKNDYYKELNDKFLELYIDKTGDKEILKAISYPFGLVGIMYVHPTWVPGILPEVRKSFYEHVVAILKRKEFFWPK